MTVASELGISEAMAKRIADLRLRVINKEDHFDSFDIEYNEVQDLVPFNIYHLIYPFDDPSQK